MKLPFLLRLIFNRFFFQKLAAISLLVLFAVALQDFFFVFLITFLFAFLFLDLSNWISRKMTHVSVSVRTKWLKKALIASNRIPFIVTGVYVAFIAMLIFIFSSLVPQVLEESKGIIKEVPGIIESVEVRVAALESSMKVDLGLKEAIGKFFDKQSTEETIKNVFENVRTAGILIGKLLIALILSYVFIIDRGKISKFLESTKRGNFSFLYDEYSVIFSKIGKGFGLIFKAQALIALVNAVLTVLSLLLISFIQMVFVGGADNLFPYISTLGILVFIFGFVPVLGFVISTIPILIVGFSYGGTTTIAMLLLMIAVVHAVEAYYLNPKIVSSYMDFPVFVTFIILLVSEHLFGFIGLLIGVPLFYIIIDLTKDLDIFVNNVKKVSSAIDTTKTSTKEAIHKNIRLSRSQGPNEE